MKEFTLNELRDYVSEFKNTVVKAYLLNVLSAFKETKVKLTESGIKLVNSFNLDNTITVTEATSSKTKWHMSFYFKEGLNHYIKQECYSGVLLKMNIMPLITGDNYFDAILKELSYHLNIDDDEYTFNKNYWNKIDLEVFQERHAHEIDSFVFHETDKYYTYTKKIEDVDNPGMTITREYSFYKETGELHELVIEKRMNDIKVSVEYYTLDINSQPEPLPISFLL